MKIGILDPVGGHGGMDYYTFSLGYGLRDAGGDVIIYTCDKTKDRGFLDINYVKTYGKLWQFKSKLFNLYFFIKGYLKSFIHAKRNGISVIHFHFFDLGFLNLVITFLSIPFGFKRVLTLHDVSSFNSRNIRFIESAILRCFDLIIVHNYQSYLELSNKNISTKLIEIIPHGNYKLFVKSTQYRINENEKLKLLFFGQIKKVKGLDVLLNAIGILKSWGIDVELTVAGKIWHDSKEYYESIVDRLSINENVNFNFGYIEDSEVERYFNQSDLVVLPYRKIYQSGVLLLSMSYGRAVLTSNLPAFTNIISDGETGFLFESDDPEDLATKIRELHLSRNKICSVVENAENLINKKFDWNIIGKKTLETYEKIMDPRIRTRN